MLFDALHRRPSYLTQKFKPRLINPTGDISIEIYEPESFEATAFRRSGGKKEHAYTRWQISEDEMFENIVFDSGEDTENLIKIAVTDTTVEMLEEYYIRVMYARPDKISEWSNIVKFKTAIFESVVNDWNESVYSASLLGFDDAEDVPSS